MVSLFPHPASFRSHLAVGTLAFGYILPTTGRIRDFHPLETCAARRTQKKAEAPFASALTLYAVIIGLSADILKALSPPAFENSC